MNPPDATQEAAVGSSPGGGLTVSTGPLSFAVFALARTHRGLAGAMLRELNLHPGQELLLMQLLDRDGQTQSELLASVGLDHSTVSKSLRRMQDAGLLRREPAAHDRRVLLVHLTDKGRALREPLQQMWTRLEERSTRALTPEQIDTFVALARVIEQSLR
ncbi:MarR family winged helix-turn-helix transcriptional regulator [Cryptosporangium aurantiacum]|uniref:DNA-binding transcriptional regulator, MarR family n=1 Tax=Cryptosporangium aurantiacum TaxID=134849 RepID=A0A1M7REU9_9ACTN|nr:MarR family winged helix-turn-helix transcriptional regulator [Cryptosporangium aurantiacum]SHN44701.1 DNA-binding transcriptional regulator, MarR family [Cryptosporangium aurantiacum]